MAFDDLSHEETIQLITDKILDGASDDELLNDGFTEIQIEEAHLECLSIYF